jgi:pyruvate/2-oxoglutarate dehydrogenase complex dihydrolipoamide dehydrogenase (E3) component
LETLRPDDGFPELEGRCLEVGSSAVDYDLVVIGGGAAGLGAARFARQRRARVLLVQDGPIGGDCTFTGCVPSKTLIEAAGRGACFVDAMTAVRRAVETIAATEDAEALRREGIDVLTGRARLRGGGRIELDGRTLTADHIILATGAGPIVPGIDGLTDVAYLTNENVFTLTERPDSLAVLGGGAIGCELAQAFARLGTRVTVIEALDRLLPREDVDASRVLTGVFANDGITVRTGQPVIHVEPLDRPSAARLVLAGGDAVTTDALLVAIGRTPETSGLDPAAAGVQLDERGFVQVDTTLRTTARAIYAVGDVTGLSPFTHAAYAMGRVAVANTRRSLRKRRFHPDAMPRVTYTTPEIAHVGITEADATRIRGARVAYLPMSELDRAIAAEATDGFVKLIVGPRPLLRGVAGGRVLGATIVAPRAGEMLHEIVVARHARMFPAHLALATHAYPTWSIAIQQVAAQLFTEMNGRRARPPQPAEELTDPADPDVVR